MRSRDDTRDLLIADFLWPESSIHQLYFGQTFRTTIKAVLNSDACRGRVGPKLLYTTNPETVPPLCVRTVLNALLQAERNSWLDNFSDAVFEIASRPLTGVQITASGCRRLLDAFQSAEASVSCVVPQFRAEFAVGRDAVTTILWFWSKGGQHSAEDRDLAFLAKLGAESFFFLLERICTERMIASVKADMASKRVAA